MTLHLLAALPLLALATYRMWRLIAVDTITEPIRSRIIFRNGRIWEWFAALLMCSWCLGFWLAGVAVAAYVAATGLSWWWIALTWPAVSACVGIIDAVVERLTAGSH